MLLNKDKPQTFVEFAESKGIQLLKDDLVWIKELTKHVPIEQKRTILRRYIDEWCVAMAECERVIKRQNEGRKAANTYLREIINATRNSEVV